MKRHSLILLSTLLTTLLVSSTVADQPNKRGRSKKNVIAFSFDKKPLTTLIDELSQKKKVNIILPQNASQLEELKQQTITYHPQNRTEIPVSEAWSLLHTFLELSGFGISLKKDNTYAIEKIGLPREPGLNRSVLPIYADVPPNELPDSQEHIRYITYLQNLKVPGPQDKDNPIARILADMVTPGAPIVFEPKTNAIIITDKANTISSVMHIIKELDNSGFKESIEIIHLNNVPVQDVVNIFESLKAAAGGDSSGFIRGDAKTESLSLFAEDTTVISDTRRNNLILMGRQAATERIADFVKDYMDVPQETGKSILHYYDLQYLDATEFAEVLGRIVAPLIETGQQATAEAPGGAERYFQGVVIMAEEVKVQTVRQAVQDITLEARGGLLETGLGEQQTITGGNRLIVAARHDDWVRIKSLIDEIDKPQPYVILEVLVVDIRGINQKLIAGSVRNKTATTLPNDGFQFLSTNITDVNTLLGNKPAELAEDLLRVITGADSNNPSVTSLLAPGSLLLSINDPNTPGVFGLLQILDTLLNSKIISHPYLITTNNQKATIASQQLRRVRGDAVPGAAGVITVQIIDLPATLQVQMIPRLSSLERLSLQVAVDINEFIDNVSNTRLTRRVNTNANMQSGQILAIGGLTRTDQSDTVAGTPLLERIPIIGNFFSNKSKATTKNNLAIFVCPTIVQPKLRGGLNVYTADKIRKARRDIDDYVVFGDTKDPITRLFFQNDLPTDTVMKKFISEVDNPPDAELIKTTREKRQERLKPKKRPKPSKKEPPKPGPVLPLPA